MTHTLATLLLALCCLAGLVLVPLGLPGLWVMVAGVVGYGWLTDFRSVGVTTIALVLGLALVGEIVRSEEHTSELQSQSNLVCRLLLEKKKKKSKTKLELEHM